MKRIVNSLSLRCFLMMLVGLFATANLALAQDGTKHIVTLNSNSGYVTPETIECTQGQAFGDLPTPTRNGFTFAGWYTIPGQESTRVTNRTLYDYNIHQEMLHARWTKKTAQLVFIGLDGHTEVGRMTVSGDGGSLVDIPASTYKLSVDDGKFFAGYYTRINGEGERIYSGVAENGELHPVITHEASFAQNSVTYLYAFQTHVKHTTHWDYTYSTKVDGNVNWININQDDQTTRSNYGKLTFMNNEGTVLKWIYFKADDLTNKSTTGMSADLGTHTTTVGRFHLQLADATHAETTNGAIVNGDDATANDGKAGDWNVYFTDEQLSHFTRYNFEPIIKDTESGDLKPAQNWLRTTDPVAHDTWFTFTGASDDNNAPLPWTVTLTNLKVYPDYIIVKPLFWDGAKWAEISQLIALDGVTCEKQNEQGEGEGSSATYSGSYPVWKNGSTEAYGYAVGMVGFEVNGQKVYLNQEAPGHFSDLFNSAKSTVETDTKTSKWNGTTFPLITYTINAPTIPVVRFLEGSAPGAKLDGATPHILWGHPDETISDFSTKYFATCPGCTFLGWSETDGATTATYTDSYTFSGAMTLYPVWQDDEAPVITPEKEKSCINPVDVVVTDNIKVASVTVMRSVDGGEATDVTSALTITDLNTPNATFTLPAPEKPGDGTIVKYVYTIDAKDGANNVATQRTVTIWSDHEWGEWKPAQDPTDTEDGCTTEFHKCKNCGEYETRTEGKIIPAKSILVKTGDGGVETTRDWDGKVNAAVAKVKTDAETGEEWTYLKMTANAEVEYGVINTPVLPAILDLNGKSLKVDDGEGNLVDGIIYGNPDVTILLKDDGELEYTNGSTVKGTVGSVETPIRYVRDYFAGYDNRAGKWQALYLPFAYGSTEKLPYTFGTPNGVEITSTEAKLSIALDVDELAANTHYFVKSSTGKLQMDITGVDLLPYEDPTAHQATVSTDYTFVGSLTNFDNIANEVKRSYWVLTNGGEFSWAKKGSHQRPYHWVVYENEHVVTSAGNARAMILVELDNNEETGIKSIERAELDQNAAIYNVSGVKVPANKQLPRGLYISNGKKFYVK